MTLPQVTFFAETVLPLFIFEPRYRQMIEDVLAENVMFAVAATDESRALDTEQFEPSCSVATAGIVRACRKNPDGTSNLLLQGLSRVEIVRIVREDTYRIVAVKQVSSINHLSTKEALELRRTTCLLIARLMSIQTGDEESLPEFLNAIESNDTFIDVAAYSFCDDPGLKQKILQTLDTSARYALYLEYLNLKIDSGDGAGVGGRFGDN